jgi:glycosyltransferase involved in cell wall biosynthesis
MDNLVSIIIPNYNNAEFLKSSVSSALLQDYPNIEVIVVDDGSTDDSVTILKEFGSKIRILQQSNSGAAAARNLGIKNASGEFLAFLDSDDIWRTSKITTQMMKINTSDYGLVYCSLQEFYLNGSRGLIHNTKFEGYCYKYFKWYPSRAIIVGGCSTALIRKSILGESVFFDESFSGVGEDLDFFRRVCRVTKVGYTPEVLVDYRRHSASLSAVTMLRYFEGNKKAVLNLFSQDSSLGSFERRIIWCRFLFSYLKSFVRQRDLKNSSRIVLSFFKSIPS